MDLSRPLAHNVNEKSSSTIYTATEDCYIWGYMTCNTTLRPWVSLLSVSADDSMVQGANVVNERVPYFFPMRSGQTLYGRPSGGDNIFTYKYWVYPVLK